jgi:hypothetical protein
MPSRETAPGVQWPAHNRGLKETRELGDVGLRGAPLNEHTTCATTVMRGVCNEDVQDYEDVSEWCMCCTDHVGGLQ